MNASAFVADPTLDNVLHNIARGNEDLLQHMRLHLIERAARDPKFATQQIGYWIRTAKWEASHYWEKATTYDRYVSSVLPTKSTTGAYDAYLSEAITEESTAFDELPAPCLTPEQEFDQRQADGDFRAALSNLTPQQAEVARLLMDGFKPSEIAKMMRVSRSRVSNLTREMSANIRQRLAV